MSETPEPASVVFLSATQALVQLALLQRQRDRATGLDTAGYISGYRGSPIGGYDLALARAQVELEAEQIRFVPGINEDLAATAIWGTQQLGAFPGRPRDGVFAIWYGKGPGVDRSGDILRHANQAGSSRHGGVLAIAGDDHGARSSSVAAQTDFIFQAVSMPVLAPATVQDHLDYGLLGLALSRFSGLWVALKAVTDTLETAGLVDLSPARLTIAEPQDFALPEGGLNLRWPEEPFPKIEERLVRWKLPAALAWARANRLDRNVFGCADATPARLGIVSTGKGWLDVMQALADLRIDAATAQAIGLRVYKVAMPWPLEPAGIAAFCEGCDEVLVIEEKRSLIETQLKDLLYRQASRPRITGKHDESGAALLPEWGELSPEACARVIVARLHRAEGAAPLDAVLVRGDATLARLDAKHRFDATHPALLERTPYFCSGCPHNTSTRVPEGSQAMAGVGCHVMAMWMERDTATYTQMGGEGITWAGQAPYSHTPHMFQNLGDGTYFHSGSLAIRQAVATHTPITYKILFNDAVAMTGGQPHDGALTPAKIARQVAAEGVRRIVVVSEAPASYPAGSFDPGVQVVERGRLDEVQRELREYPDVSVLIYDQICAAEKRRRRKRGSYPEATRRVFINAAVCDGCGDCSVQSNCVSVEPLETPLGRKRTINQSSCNQDATCVDGFCPSFVSVVGGRLRRGSATKAPSDLPPPRLPAIAGSYALLVTGIGGSGVITVGHLLGQAAQIEGKAVTVLDMTGLAQKNGAVVSFVRLGHPGEPLYAPRIGSAGADAVIGCDLVVSAGREVLARIAPGQTRIVVNVAATPTADFVRQPDWQLPQTGLEAALAAAAGSAEAIECIDASRLAVALLGDAIMTNVVMLGFAFQQGLVPLSAAALEQAIERNGVAVQTTLAAFAWGRAAAADRARVEAAARPATSIDTARKPPTSLDDIIEQGRALLTDYQDARYAQRYTAFVTTVRAAEQRVAASTELTAVLAHHLARLMASKDEYEVARLYRDPAFRQRLQQQFEGDFQLRFHLAPPLWSRRNARGELVKREYGAWVYKAFALLAGMRRLRGTAFDVFGWTAERRAERALVDDYRRTISSLLERLDRENLALAVQIAATADEIRGFGHVRDARVARALARREELLREFEQPQALRAAA